MIGFGQEIPPKPADRYFIQDYAGLIEPDETGEIGKFQKQAFQVYDTPILVVTINRMRDYMSPRPIEEFARKWFDAWEIGTLGNEGGGSNKGILLLVSRADRKARIELGADWGHLWDQHCQRIMDREIIPEFKKSRYSEGIAAGVVELFEMAKMGPEVEAPRKNLADSVREISAKEKITPTSLLPGNIGLLALAAGVGCLVLAIFFPDHRGFLIKAGLFLIVAVLLTYIALIVIALMGKSTGRSSGGGGFSSGGGFSGGFSGGGGASGSW